MFNKHQQMVWAELEVGGSNGCSASDWLQPVAHIQISVMSLPGLCSAVLWNERQDVWLLSLSLSFSTSHHGNSPRARSLALKRTLLCHLLAVSSSGQIYMQEKVKPMEAFSFSWLMLVMQMEIKSFTDILRNICFSSQPQRIRLHEDMRVILGLDKPGLQLAS